MNLRRSWTCLSVSAGLLVACAGKGSSASSEVAHQTFTISRVEKVDLLFVVDNSESMASKQASLRARLPELMHVLTRGERAPDDPEPFTPVRDLHIGVVSTDMGIAGVEWPNANCHADGGDDGRLLHSPHPAMDLTCDASYPAFLSYEAGEDTDQLAHDFACVSNLGTSGCGFEQPLESAFKALWPKQAPDGAKTNPYRFISITEQGTWGRGDSPEADGGNLGFLRNDPDDPSLIVVVVVTDEDDCSVSRTDHLKPYKQLPVDSPYRSEDVNLRCFFNKQYQYDVRDRYLAGLRKLRPGREDLVVFSAIAGLPPDLVDRDALQRVDFSDAAARNEFYDGILQDPRMIETIDPSTNPGSGTGKLEPSCIRVEGDGVIETAYPPRRLVELAQGFGDNGMVQSICQDDFAPALERIVDTMAKPLREMCTTEKLARQSDGLVECSMYWELLEPGDCRALGDFVDARDSNGQRCRIRQLAVHDGQPEGGSGWYYDDFTSGLARTCSGGMSRRIAFSSGVRAPQGVSVKVECDGEARLQ